MEVFGFYLYLIFIVSWFLHLPARIPALGAVRFDLLLIVVICLLFFINDNKDRIQALVSDSYRKINHFILLIIVITPFSHWPGSALKTGFPTFAKAVVFFYFTVWFIQTESRLKTFITVFVLCQSFRVVEPFYLHVTTGYWGNQSYIGDGNFMQRLSGAPFDVVNPNGLAFVILMLIAFILYLCKENYLWKVYALVFVPLALYVLYLTGSRSGMLGLAVIVLVFIFQSQKKVLVAIPILLVSVFLILHMQGTFKDRYLSIFDDDTKNSRTATHRIDGIFDDIAVGMNHPVFGHGLGTSGEANFNYAGRTVISHNLYAEVFQELGIVGLVYFLTIITGIFKNLRSPPLPGESPFTRDLRKSLFIFAIMNVFFAMASFGLSSYEWYLLTALSLLVSQRLPYAVPESIGRSRSLAQTIRAEMEAMR
jgi:O-antigen ligase